MQRVAGGIWQPGWAHQRRLPAAQWQGCAPGHADPTVAQQPGHQERQGWHGSQGLCCQAALQGGPTGAPSTCFQKAKEGAGRSAFASQSLEGSYSLNHNLWRVWCLQAEATLWRRLFSEEAPRRGKPDRASCVHPLGHCRADLSSLQACMPWGILSAIALPYLQLVSCAGCAVQAGRGSIPRGSRGAQVHRPRPPKVRVAGRGGQEG